MKRFLKNELLMIFCALACCIGVESKEIRPSVYGEVAIIDLVAELLSDHPVFVQAGAYPEVLKRLFFLRPGAKAYIFEPNLDYLQIPQYQQRVEVFPWALSKESQKALFYLSKPPVNPHLGSLLPAESGWNWYYSDEEQRVVECKNLQEWASERGVLQIDCLWLNAGGSELDILKSIPEFIDRVQVVFVEAYEQKFREGCALFEEIKGFLADHDLELLQRWNVQNFQGYAVFMKKGLAEVVK